MRFICQIIPYWYHLYILLIVEKEQTKSIISKYLTGWTDRGSEDVYQTGYSFVNVEK